jgi:hypothetical protein
MYISSSRHRAPRRTLASSLRMLIVLIGPFLVAERLRRAWNSSCSRRISNFDSKYLGSSTAAKVLSKITHSTTRMLRSLSKDTRSYLYSKAAPLFHIILVLIYGFVTLLVGNSCSFEGGLPWLSCSQSRHTSVLALQGRFTKMDRLIYPEPSPIVLKGPWFLRKVRCRPTVFR